MRPFAAAATFLLLVLVFKESAAENVDFQWDPQQCRTHPPKPCGSGWFRLDGSRCVKIHQTMETFDNAESLCQDEGGHVITIKDEETLTKLTCVSYLNPYFFVISQRCWVGAKRVKPGSPEFEWIDGSGTVEMSFTDVDENYDCLQMGKWTPFGANGVLGWIDIKTAACDGINWVVCETTG